jgi:hypothetical protein
MACHGDRIKKEENSKWRKEKKGLKVGQGGRGAKQANGVDYHTPKVICV